MLIANNRERLPAHREMKMRALILLNHRLGLVIKLDLSDLLLQHLGIAKLGILARVRLDYNHSVLLADHVAIPRHTQSSQYVVARAHNGAYIGQLEPANHRARLGLEPILHDDQAEELEIALQLLSLDALHFDKVALDGARRYGDHSIAFSRERGQNALEILGQRLGLGHFGDFFRRAFAVEHEMARVEHAHYYAHALERGRERELADDGDFVGARYLRVVFELGGFGPDC